jgi:hypothetical protein
MAGQLTKSNRAARGSRVSRPGVADDVLATGPGWRSSHPNPSSARISPTLVRFSGLPSTASCAEISYVDSPCRRSSITRPRAQSLAGAVPGGGPGRRGMANNSSFPARYSRTRFTIAQRV